MKNRIISLVLTLSLCASLLVLPAHAEYIYNPVPNDSFITQLAIAFKQITGIDVTSSMGSMQLPVTGPCSMSELERAREYYNSWLIDLYRAVDYTWPNGLGSPAAITYDNRNGIYRLVDNYSNEYVMDSMGRFPYYEPPVDQSTINPDPNQEGASVPATPSISKNGFVRAEYADTSQVVLVTQDALSQLVTNLSAEGINGTMWETVINGTRFYVVTDAQHRSFYCNSLNQPFVAKAQSSATDIKYDYITNNDNSTTINDSQVIDVADGVLNVITETGDRFEYYIDQITFDFDNRQYTVNAYDYTYNITNNYYEYNYYTYNISYNVTNTYINYIGSTSEFVPTEYKLYYELPDGRSSADLTADEIAGMSFQFYDVINYAKSATDTYIRALYHFDGDTDDSSYFSTQGDFIWTNGASLTYMESGAFNGALYLDSNSHDFQIKLPSRLSSGDFTLQFRYYQASQADTLTNRENYIKLGNTQVMTWDEATLYKSTSTSMASLSIGSWQELAITRSGSYLYFYHNGLCIGSLSTSAVFTEYITFHFGSTSRSYSMLDELRVLNYAIASGTGSSYACTTVPHDTNLVLVLPGGTYPIADEYWDFNNEGNLLSFQDFTQNPLSLPPWQSLSPFSYAVYDGYVTLSYSGTNPYGRDPNDQDSTFGYQGGLNYYIGTYYKSGKNAYWTAGPHIDFTIDETYTFSVVDRNGNVYSNTFVADYYAASKKVEFEWGSLIYWTSAYGVSGSGKYNVFLSIMVNKGSSLDIVYAELVQGSMPNTGHEFINCIYSSDELKPNTAAVQTDIPITGYTVGGVRPTFPKRGHVWFTVENKRVRGCYVYTGTAWESVNCRYYTGTRWIPIYAFDMDTLADLWDVADGSDVITPITTESGFWNWWKAQWLDFRAWLSGSSGGPIGGSGTTVDPTAFPTEPPDPSDPESSGWSFLDLLVALKDGTWKIITGVVGSVFGGVAGIVSGVVSVGNYFDAYNDGSEENIFGIVNYGGEDIWD